MSGVLRKDIETKNLRKTIIKFSKDIPVVGDRLRGVFSITGYRVYEYFLNYVEVDVIFKGEIFVKIEDDKGSQWYDSSVLKNDKHNLSIIRVNKFLKGRMYVDINNRLRYFNAEMKGMYELKKIKWI
jgi:hypothetical protein